MGRGILSLGFWRKSEDPHYHIHVRYRGRIAYSNYICLQKLKGLFGKPGSLHSLEKHEVGLQATHAAADLLLLKQSPASHPADSRRRLQTSAQVVDFLLRVQRDGFPRERCRFATLPALLLVCLHHLQKFSQAPGRMGKKLDGMATACTLSVRNTYTSCSSLPISRCSSPPPRST